MAGRTDYQERREARIDRLNAASEKATTQSAAENNTAISSDDPDAIAKLTAKIEKLEAERECIKAFNREARKNGTEPAPWYALPYLSRDIKAARERIEKLKAVDEIPDETLDFDGGTVEVDSDLNRVVIWHDSKPDADIISALKANGFHWSRSEGAWIRLKSLNALAAAKRLCGIEDVQK